MENEQQRAVRSSGVLARLNAAIVTHRREYEGYLEDGDSEWARNVGFRIEGLRMAIRIVEDYENERRANRVLSEPHEIHR